MLADDYSSNPNNLGFLFGEPKRNVVPPCAAKTGRTEVQYLYRADKNYAMMDSQTFDQFELDEAFVGSAALFMKEGLEGIIVALFEGRPIGIKLPPIVELIVTEVSPLLDDTTGGATLNATLETGATVAVPSYVKVGSTIQIDTRLRAFVDDAT